MKKIVATLKINEGKLDDYLEMAKELIPQVREEEGCISYTLHQSVQDPQELTFIEEYVDDEAIAYHGSTPYFQKAAAIQAELIDGDMTVLIIEPII